MVAKVECNRCVLHNVIHDGLIYDGDDSTGRQNDSTIDQLNVFALSNELDIVRWRTRTEQEKETDWNNGAIDHEKKKNHYSID